MPPRSALGDGIHLGAINCQEGPQDGHEGEPVEGEQPTGTEGALQEGSQCRPDDARAGHHRGVQRDRIADLVGFDELDGEAAACRIVEGVHHTEHDREDVERGQVGPAGKCQGAEQQSLRRLETLGDDGHPPLVSPIGDGARPTPQEEHRQELAEEADTGVGGVAGELVDDERHRRHLHPGADIAHQQPDEEQPRIAMPQRAEHRRGTHTYFLPSWLTGRMVRHSPKATGAPITSA